MKISRRKFLERAGSITAICLLAPLYIVKADTPQRPPGALNEQDFSAHCIRCLKCGEECPTGVISFNRLQKGGLTETPILTNKDQCNLCMNCINICPTGALRPLSQNPELQAHEAKKAYSIDDLQPRFNLGVAQLTRKNCILYNGRNRKCLLCYEVCPLKGDAIIVDEQGRPVIDKIRCYGCGLCEIACPPIAITMPMSREDKRSYDLYDRINKGSFYERYPSRRS
ncbi:4Fe-4S binding protein [Desulfosporosinus shakirovi]|uniref:4Fe-4S binding protein n=1 Tax=Desulfosporosinus shakirovi TaxID=2885154 RepID=UPI001E598EAA|nr:4Fe-4S binding protein [Desulfosporosinus sp. SRJS8]MCB8814944.1 4Fe-4S binding protein [Desulfosporosinus sp. SRJS8]